jgi:hypothetical protein
MMRLPLDVGGVAPAFAAGSLYTEICFPFLVKETYRGGQ